LEVSTSALQAATQVSILLDDGILNSTLLTNTIQGLGSKVINQDFADRCNSQRVIVQVKTDIPNDSGGFCLDMSISNPLASSYQNVNSTYGSGLNSTPTVLYTMLNIPNNPTSQNIGFPLEAGCSKLRLDLNTPNSGKVNLCVHQFSPGSGPINCQYLTIPETNTITVCSDVSTTQITVFTATNYGETQVGYLTFESHESVSSSNFINYYGTASEGGEPQIYYYPLDSIEKKD